MSMVDFQSKRLVTTPNTTSKQKALVVIDRQVSDYHSLVRAVVPGNYTIVLNSDCDGIEQISAALSSNRDIVS